VTISSDAALKLSKSIIEEFHRYFIEEGVDNYDHVIAVKRIITATCRHFADESSEIEKELLDFAFDLFLQEWLRLAGEEEEEYDREEEVEEAKRVFFRTYKPEKQVR